MKTVNKHETISEVRKQTLKIRKNRSGIYHISKVIKILTQENT